MNDYSKKSEYEPIMPVYKKTILHILLLCAHTFQE